MMNIRFIFTVRNLIICLAAIAAMFIVIQIYVYSFIDVLDKQTASVYKMINQIGNIQNKIEVCLKKNNFTKYICQSDFYDKDVETADYRFFVRESGEIIGIDFKRSTAVIFTPRIVEKSITWDCGVYPDKTLKKLPTCHSLL